MTQEEKQLLLRDLCVRLPYGTIVRNYATDEDDVLTYSLLEDFEIVGLEYIKPYFRPMPSMTEEEKVEFDKVLKSCNNKVFACPDKERRYNFFDAEQEDFMNAHHFDYRGLIPMGLALEAPEGMYNKEESETGSEISVPKTVDEAVKTLAKILSDEDREYLLENGAISMHDSLGRWIRNEWGLWTGSELKNELKKKGFEHPDDMSNYIIEEFIKNLG